MKHVYTSIDIGSDTIKVVVCELYKNKLNLLAASSVPSKGIKKGLISDASLASEAVRSALDEIEGMLGIKIKKIIATVPSYFASFNMIEGSIAIDNDDNVINGDHITKVLQVAKKDKLKPTYEVASIIPIDFKLDNEEIVKNPNGLVSSNLSARAIMVSIPKKNIYSVVNLLEKLDIEVIDIAIGSVGSIYTFKNKQIDEEVGTLINIGSDVTTISLYNKGIVVKESIIQIGGRNVDNDISYVYRIKSDEAVKIKEKFALAHKKNASVSDTYEIVNKDDEIVKINQFEVSEVAMMRIDDMLEKIKREIKVLYNKEIDYIIITGGLTNMEDFNNIAVEIFGKDVIIGNVKLIGLRNNKYVTAIGNIVYFINKLKLQNTDYSMISKSDMEDLSTTKKSVINLSNDSMLGKVFGYFFSE